MNVKVEYIPIGRGWFLEYVNDEYVKHIYLGPEYGNNSTDTQSTADSTTLV